MDCLKKTSKTGTTHGLNPDELQKAVLEATEMADSMVGEESLNQSLTPNDFKDGSKSFEFPDKDESNDLTTPETPETPDSGIRMSIQDSEDLQVSTCDESTEISNVESGEVKISVESNESSKPSEHVSDEFSQIIETEDQKSHRSLRKRSSISKPEMKINEKSKEIPNVKSAEIETKVKSNVSSISKPSKNVSGTESEDKKSHRSLRKSTLLDTKRSSLSSSVVKPEVIAKIKDESKESSISKHSKQVSKEVSQKVKTEPEHQKSHSKRSLRSSISSPVVNPEIVAKIKSGNSSVKQNKRSTASSTISKVPTHQFLNPNNDDGFEDFEPPLMVVRPDAVKSEDFQSKIPQLDGNSSMPDNSTNTESGKNEFIKSNFF